MTAGNQLKVYLHPEDRASVNDFVQRELGGVLLLERSRDRASLQTSDSTDGSGRLIGLKSQMSGLEPRFVESTGEWLLGLQSGPLIEWWFSRLDNDVLYPGRFYYLPLRRKAAGSGDLDEFARMAARLFRWVRQFAPVVPMEWGPERLGPVASRMLKDGGLYLRQNPPGSRI